MQDQRRLRDKLLAKYDPLVTDGTKYNDRHKPAGSPNGTGGEFDNKPGNGGSNRRSTTPKPVHKPENLKLPTTGGTQKYPKSPNPSRATHVTVKNPTIVTIHRDDGSSETRSGGSKAWRNNNPGNIYYGPFSARHGAIGKNGYMAVFPDAATGDDANKALMRGPAYSSLTIDEAIYKRSPPKENDTVRLQKEISKQAGIARNRKIDSLSDEEFARFMEAIYLHEGWKEGKVTTIKPR